MASFIAFHHRTDEPAPEVDIHGPDASCGLWTLKITHATKRGDHLEQFSISSPDPAFMRQMADAIYAALPEEVPA